MQLIRINPAVGPADLFVLASDGVWCPAYEVSERVIDLVYTTTIYVHHPSEGVHAVTLARTEELRAAGRVRAGGTSAPRSRRLVTLPTHEVMVPLRERLRRLLNARARSLQTLTGEDMSEVRHRAVSDATGGLTASSMDRRVTDDEMGHAVSFVEDLLYAVGFDFEVEDGAYFARRLQRVQARPVETIRLAA